jgi:hypothetical protein
MSSPDVPVIQGTLSGQQAAAHGDRVTDTTGSLPAALIPASGRVAGATAYQHALTTGFSRAFLVAAGIALLNLVR